MEGMINYIFWKLESTDDSMRELQKELKKQKRWNQAAVVFSLSVVAYLYISNICRYGQDRRIDDLEDEIKELKHTKGE